MNPHNMKKNGDRPNKQTYTIEIQYTIIITIVAGPPSIMIKREIKAPMMVVSIIPFSGIHLLGAAKVWLVK